MNIQTDFAKLTDKLKNAKSIEIPINKYSFPVYYVWLRVNL